MSYRIRNPIKAKFYNIKHHAKARGIGFFLTFEEFNEFCNRTQYHIKIGREANCFSLDRIRGDMPYSADNIQLKTVSENSAKSWNDYSREAVDF